MKTLLPLRGIITVLNTPFTEDGGIDAEGLTKHIEYALHAGVAGFLVPAMASEVAKLTAVERTLLVKTTVEAARGQAVVIGGASAEDPAARRRLASQCLELGCEGVLASIPYQNETEYVAAVRELAALQPPFLMLQDWAPDSFGVPVALVTRLFEEVPCFRCLKVEVVPAGVKYSQVLDATQGRLHVSGGWAVMQMVEALDRGVHAFMPTGLHYTYVEIFRRYHAGDRAGAQALHAEVLPVLAFSNQHLDMSIHFFKRLLHSQGVYATARVREPILPFDPVHEHLTAELIAKATSLEQGLGWRAS
ncbi:MAG: dihydrodipicolinate synthase family protein [Candidatus Hydrogenedentes bacterium]|nr:dihydrodipicolinate synthase family protein [Candidatus Hydrogenedentota bacterium]